MKIDALSGTVLTALCLAVAAALALASVKAAPVTLIILALFPYGTVLILSNFVR